MDMPPGYDVSLLVSSLYDLAVPFVSIAFLFCAAAVIHRIMKNV